MVSSVQIVYHRVAIVADCHKEKELMHQVALVVNLVDLPRRSLVEKSETDLSVLASSIDKLLKLLIVECRVFVGRNLVISQAHRFIEIFLLPVARILNY